MPSKVEISHKTIIFTVIFLLLLWLLFQIKDIILLVFVAFILMSAFKPLADYFDRRKIPRILSVLVIYVLIISFLIFSVSTILPPLVVQSIKLGENLPQYVKTILPDMTLDYQTITSQIAPLGQNLVNVTIGIFSNLVTLFSLIVISFYLLMERQHLETHLTGFIGENISKKFIHVIGRIEERLGAWVRGQLMLALSIGISTFIGISLLGLPYGLALSIFAGILEIVPIVGPIIAAIPAVLIAVSVSPLIVLLTILVYFIIQQLEAHLVVPLVMKKAIGIPPVFTIIALMIGARLDGIGGALMAIPVYVTIETVLSEYFKLKEIK